MPTEVKAHDLLDPHLQALILNWLTEVQKEGFGELTIKVRDHRNVYLSRTVGTQISGAQSDWPFYTTTSNPGSTTITT